MDLSSPGDGGVGEDEDTGWPPPNLLSDEDIDELIGILLSPSLMEQISWTSTEETSDLAISHLAYTFPTLPAAHRNTLASWIFDRGRPPRREALRTLLEAVFDEDRIISHERRIAIGALLQAFQAQSSELQPSSVQELRVDPNEGSTRTNDKKDTDLQKDPWTIRFLILREGTTISSSHKVKERIVATTKLKQLFAASALL